MQTVNNIVEKSNILNSMQIEVLKDDNMTLNELRFFCLYISKLNAREPDKRTVSIPISEFEELFGVKLNTTQFDKKMINILHRVVKIQEKDGKQSLATLYSKFTWSNDATKELEITCNYDVFPYLFQLTGNYTAYIIGNIAKLNSVAKIRLYELFKQYEKIKTITIQLEDLQKKIYSNENDFRFFKLRVLEPSIKSINAHTDIFVSYEKVLQMRKVVAIKFTIAPQKRKIEVPLPTSISEPINEHLCFQECTQDIQMIHKCNRDMLIMGYTKYSDEQIEMLFELAKGSYQILNDAMISMLSQNQDNIKYPYNYLHKIISSSINNQSNLPISKSKMMRDGDQPKTYTLDNIDNLIIDYVPPII